MNPRVDSSPGLPSRLVSKLPLPDSFEAAYLEANGILPLEVADGRLRVAVAGDPDVEVLDQLEVDFDLPLEPVPVSRDELADGIRRAYAAAESVVELVRDLGVQIGTAPNATEDGLADARDLANQPPVIRYVNLLIKEAHEAHASDVHLEATRTGLRTRFRIDGVLTDVPSPPKGLQAAVVSRVKLLAELDIAERRAPQDGRIRVRLEERELDLRVSTVPTLYGESRLGAQFDAAANNLSATGVYAIDVVVSALYASGLVSTSIPTKLLVVNELTSPVAAGWTLGGIQRLHSQPDGSALITEGDGSAVHFWNVGGTFVAPAGEFSTLTGTGGWTRSYADGSGAVFDATGRMTQLYDRFGNATTVTYDGDGRVWQIKDPLNLALTLGYGTNGLASVQDPGSPARTTTVSVDASRRLTAVTDPDNVSTRFVTDAAHLLWKVFDRRGDSTKFGYNSGGSRKLVFVTFPPVPIHGQQDPISPTSSRYPWQHVGVPYTSTAATPAPAPLSDTVRVRIVDGRGFSTYFTVNPWGAPVAITDAVSVVDSIWYDGNGLPVRTRYATGAVDTVAYNADGLPTFIQTAGQSAVNIRYGVFAQLDSIWGEGRPTVRHYLGFSGRIDMTVVGGQDTTRYTYDSRGRVVTANDPQGHLLVKRTYDGTNGNLSRDSLPGNRITTYLQDAFGRDTAVQAPESPLRRQHYDLLNRPTEFFDGVHPSPTVTAYDSIFVRSVTDPKGQVYGFSYNALGWLTQRIDPQNRGDQYAYDKNGNVRRWINRRADSLKYTYDGVNRLTNKTGSNTTSESWSYSADRRVVTATSPVSTETVYLHVAGVPDSVKTVMAGQTYWRRYRYTAAALLDSVDFAGSAVTLRARKYLYDAAFRALTQIRLGGASTVIARNKDLQDTAVTFPGGDRVRKLFYPLHNATQMSTTAPYNGTIARSISFDPMGRIREQVEGDGSLGRRYTYDGLGRLRSDTTVQNAAPSSTCDGNPPPIIDENGNSCVSPGGWQATGGVEFAYDSAGNRRDNGGTYNPGNRITAFAGCTYTTDNDGNVRLRTCGTETVTFFWSTESRLDSLTVGTQRVAFKYDAGGRLVRRDVNGTPQSHFLWDGADLLAELNGAGAGSVAEYSYYPGLDRPHAVVVAGQQYNAHADGLGNVIALTDGAQTVKRTYTYDAWGTATGGTDFAGLNGADRARFKGALWLGPELDVYYMRAWWYEPKAGRFLSEDPIGLEGGVNPYVYAGDDPVNGADPVGLDPCDPEPCELPPVIVEGDWPFSTARSSGATSRFLSPNRGVSLRSAGPISIVAGQQPAGCSNFGGGQCSAIQAAHQILQRSRHQLCRTLGNLSQSRLQSGQLRWNPAYRGWGHTSVSYDTYGRRATVGATELGRRAFDEPGELGNTLVHEAFHALDPYATETQAYLKEGSCGSEVGF